MQVLSSTSRSTIKHFRRKRRMPFSAVGTALLDNAYASFQTQDLSLGGCCAVFQGRTIPPLGSRLRIALPSLGFAADAVVRWVKRGEHGLVFGLKFETLAFPPDIRTRHHFVSRTVLARSG